MTTRTTLMIAAAVLALSVPAFAQEDMQQAAKDAAMKNATDNQTAFSQGIKSIKNWFGSDQPEDIEPATGTMMTDGDDIAVPPQPGVNAIEPAAGLDEDNLQTPPRYMGEQSAVDPNAEDTPSALGNASVTVSNCANPMPLSARGFAYAAFRSQTVALSPKRSVLSRASCPPPISAMRAPVGNGSLATR